MHERERARDEYLRSLRLGRVDPLEKWTDLHFIAEALSVVAAIFTHITLMAAYTYNGTLGIPVSQYAMTFVFIPAVIFSIVLTIGFTVQWRSRSIKAQKLTASINGIILVFTMYILNSRISAIDSMLIIPLAMTIGYADITLTMTTAITLALGKCVADFFILPAIPGAGVKLDGTPEAWMDFMLAIGMILFFGVVCSLFIAAEKDKERDRAKFERTQKKLVKKTITDAMTGIGNRSALREVFDYMMEDESDRKFCVAMCDIDHFKDINDTFGHEVGDEFIKGLADTLRLAQNAQPFRFGGDEFCLVFFDRAKEDAAKLCEELIVLFGEIPIAKKIRPATASFGVAEWDHRATPAELLKQADDALYRAKEDRGCVRVYRG